jgi:hypothetical protein
MRPNDLAIEMCSSRRMMVATGILLAKAPSSSGSTLSRPTLRKPAGTSLRIEIE